MLTSCNFSGGSASPRFVLDVIFARVLAWFVFQSIVYQLYNIAGPTKDGLIGLGNVFLVRLRQGFWWFHRFKFCSSNAFEFFVYTETFLAPLPTAYQEITHPSTSSWCERRLGKFRTCGQKIWRTAGPTLHITQPRDGGFKYICLPSHCCQTAMPIANGKSLDTAAW